MANEQAQQQQDGSLESYGYKQEFRRVLKLRHLVSYGLASVTPTAPFPMLGIVAIISMGQMATVYIVAVLALFFTSTSYAKMAARHPIAGSAYSYTQNAVHPHVGFVVGWALFLSYLLVPLLSVIAARDLCAQIAPSIPSWIWIVAFVVAMTAINFFGIKVTAGANTAMNAVMILAAILFAAFAIKLLLAGGGEGVLLSSKPFYNPETFDFSLIMGATAIAVFS
ncbi:MAG: amino acid permease, partial [Gemmatimonadota bacterium]|nr:amino acid permease [Gemmatimonadota bacterium]